MKKFKIAVLETSHTVTAKKFDRLLQHLQNSPSTQRQKEMMSRKSQGATKAALKKLVWENSGYRELSQEQVTKNFFENPALMRLLKYSKKVSNILDCGCGDGTILEILWRKETQFRGIDISKRYVRLGNKRLRGKKNLTLQTGDIENIDLPDKTFDLVYSAYTLEHLERPERAIKEMIRVLKKGGFLIIICPNYGSPLFPSPSSPPPGENLLSRAVKIFLKSHLCLFKKPRTLDWLRVYPKSLREKKWENDWDTVVEPYLQTLLIFLKDNKIEIVESHSTLQIMAGRVEPKIANKPGLKQKAIVAFRKFSLFLEEKGVAPYKYYGPSLFIVGRKR